MDRFPVNLQNGAIQIENLNRPVMSEKVEGVSTKKSLGLEELFAEI